MLTIGLENKILAVLDSVLPSTKNSKKLNPNSFSTDLSLLCTSQSFQMWLVLSDGDRTVLGGEKQSSYKLNVLMGIVIHMH